MAGVIQVFASGVAAAYRRGLKDTGFEMRWWAAFVYLVVFIGIRGSLWILFLQNGWSQVPIGTIHIHHMVWGLGLMLLAGFLALNGWLRVIGSAIFGAGAALVLDEFCLILFVEDTYWQDKGVVVSGAAIAVTAIVFVANVWFGRRFYEEVGATLLRTAIAFRASLSNQASGPE
jgi:hypothetical protein